MRLYNTLSRQIEEFVPLNPPLVKIYACGPTVYDYTHIGHLRRFVMDDLLRRALTFFKYEVNYVMNITDVGHLVSDDDEGEDKLEKGARRTGKTAWEVAKFYTKFFLDSIDQMGIKRPNILCNATDHVQQMIDLVRRLEKKGFTYETKQAVYFDTSKKDDYGKLSGQSLQDKKQAVRDEIQIDPDKKNPADFVLIFKCVGHFANHQMRWDSPWGEIFPGWHIECSAMSMQYLGNTLDIHTGGIEHIPVHHENEIAQSESATNEPFVRYWMHHNHLQVEGEKMSKSLGNIFSIEDVKKRGFNPMALRLLFLQSHYRQQLNFTWESLAANAEAYKKLRKLFAGKKIANIKLSEAAQIYQEKFRQALADDLQSAAAVAALWEMVKSKLSDQEKINLISEFDQVLGLKLLNEEQEIEIPQEVLDLARQRQQARQDKDFSLADKLRKQIDALGYTIEDRPGDFAIAKK